jgi:tetratricopeptide (TPR) repeat protein
MEPRSSYKVTFFDRVGPDGAIRIRALAFALTVLALTMGAGLLRGAPIHVTLLLAGTLSLLTFFGSLGLAGLAGRAARFFTSGGSSTPYEEQFSQEQALVMQRDYAGALALFEQRIAAAPGEPRVRMAAADLYMTHGENPRRAAELYREVQRSAAIAPGHDVYVSNKLADLYLGPLKEPGRALVELRRLIDRYPGSAAAKHARMALAHLKGDIVRDQPSS